MSDDSKLNYLPWAIITIVSIILLTTVVTMIIHILFLKDIYNNDFEKHRCKLQLMPFVSIIKPEISVLRNFHHCVKQTIDPLFREQTKKLDEPVINIQKSLEKTTEHTSEIKRESEKYRKKLKQNTDTISDVFLRSQSVSYYISLKMENLFYKIGAVIVTLYYFLISSINSVMILIAGAYRLIIISEIQFITNTALTAFYAIVANLNILPVPPIFGPRFWWYTGLSITHGAFTVALGALNTTLRAFNSSASQRAYCCFSPDSKLISGKNMNEYKLGQYVDHVNKKSKILGIITSENREFLYKLSDNVWVTEDHFVYCKDKKEFVFAYEICNKSNKKTNHVMCFVTDDHKIHTEEYLCADYSESDDYVKIATETLEGLNYNHSKLNPKYEYGDARNCVYGDCCVQVLKGAKRINEIKIGEKIWDDGNWTRVIGKYSCILPEDHKWLQISNTQIVSPSVIGKINSGWDKMYSLSKNVFVNMKSNKGYHLITESGSFYIVGDKPLIIRDFLENTAIYDIIEEDNKKELNKCHNYTKVEDAQ